MLFRSDVTAPSKPTNLTATSVTATQVTLTWTQSTDNIGVTGYQVQRLLGTNPPVIVGTATGNTFTDVTATPGTTYTYKVLANDAAGNQSSPSIGVRVTTPKY